MEDELESYLQELRSEGRPDSTGRFTLDRFRAQALLGRFQKGNPEHYLFHLVRAGVAARALSISVIVERDRLEVRLQGPAPVAFEQRLMKSLESPWGLTQGSPLAHLARGFLACAELGPCRLEWNTWDGVRGSQLQWEPAGLSVANLERSPWQGPESGFSFVLSGGSRDPLSESAALKRCYGFTSIPLTVGHVACSNRSWFDEGLCPSDPGLVPVGFRLAEAYGPPGPRVQLHLPSGQDRARMTLLDGAQGVQPVGAKRWCPALESPLIVYLPSTFTKGSASAVAIAWHLSGEGRVIWVQNGLRLSETQVDLGCPGAVAVSEVDGLALDAGGTQIVDNREYRHRIRDLRESVKTLWPAIPKYLPLLQLKGPQAGFLSKMFQGIKTTLTPEEKELQSYILRRLPRYQL